MENRLPNGAAEFEAILNEMRAGLPRADTMDHLLRSAATEMASFARTRDGDPAPALRLLAVDALVTEFSAACDDEAERRRWADLCGKMAAAK